ncbi:MAG TPA: HEAT repeat domain-containing protein [Candidatus Angelobacter sp.]|nr:HEAT repeat domain-containing protein [Candidatus Angelobacter sp.]
MFFQYLVRIVLWLAASVLAIDLVLVSTVLGRRLSRFIYFQKKDEFNRRLSGPIRQFLKGEMEIAELVAMLQRISGRAARDLIQEQLLKGVVNANRQAVTEVLFRLGYIDRWAREAFGRRRSRQLIAHIVHGRELPPSGRQRWAAIRKRRLFCVRRARAVSHMGQLDAKFTQVFMREALLDPSPRVHRADVAAMGHNRQVYKIPILLDLLRKAVEGAGELPVSEVKTALARYSTRDLEHFVPFLDSEDPHFRFMLVDTVREICDNTGKGPLSAQDFSESFCRWFIGHAKADTSQDVRARSARVVRHFHNPEAASTLRALMYDQNEFVRLHAVRACADPYYTELVNDVVQRISDTKWRVRESAARTLATYGKAGQLEMVHHFLRTADHYASEQIAEQMQRGGFISGIMPALGSPNGESYLAREVCAKLTHLGKTSLLTNLLLQETQSIPSGGTSLAISTVSGENTQRARARLLEILLAEPTSQVMAAVETLAERRKDDLNAKARSLLSLAQTASADGGK